LKILGLSAFYHDAACCLLVDGRLVAAAQEERFSRYKHDSRLPVEAFRFCLLEGGIGPHELDAIAYYESPTKKLSRQLHSGLHGRADPELAWLDAGRPEDEIRRRLGYDGAIDVFEHHHSHAASAFYYSGFEEAAVLTVDGVGEWATTTFGHGRGGTLEILDEIVFPNSLGLLYSAITSYLGFPVNEGEGRVMGLAPYGRPRFLDRLRQLVKIDEEGHFRLAMEYFDFVAGENMYGPAMADLLGFVPRRPGEPITGVHEDVANSLQALLEETLLALATALHRRIPVPALCLAGGVALNCVANRALRRNGPFERLWVQPAAGDAGGSLGAAALSHAHRTGTATAPLDTIYLGPRFSNDEVGRILNATGVRSQDFHQRESELFDAVVELLVRGRVVGWFRGSMELGPRALGARSLLASPMDPFVRDRLNADIKGREAFRPFAPSVLAERAGEHFDLDHASPYMLETCAVRSTLQLPAITHVDGSSRPQTVADRDNPSFAALLRRFEKKTGCPMLLNTSLNGAGEPIACTPVDALVALQRCGFDALVLEEHLVLRRDLPAFWDDVVPLLGPPRRSAFSKDRGATLYDFV